MIIGLVGKKYSGKTEVANYLSLKIGIPVYSFATPLKKLVNEMSGLTDDDKNNDNYYTGKNIILKPLHKELAKYNYSKLTSNEIHHIKAIEYYKVGEIYRMLLQYIGTNIFRSRNANHWIYRFQNLHSNESDYIIDDVRFKNEVYWIKKLDNSILCKVVMTDMVHSSLYNEHESETQLDNYTFSNIVENSLDIGKDGLYKNINEIFNLV
jgi:hypothetical protein